MNNKLNSLLKLLNKSKTEEEVKAAWAKCFELEYDTADDIDLYTPQVLFEFKFDKELTQIPQLAAVIAQVMYYLRRLKFGYSKKGIPPAFCIADRNECVMCTVTDWRDLYLDAAEEFDWDLPPSSPDSKLIAAVKKHEVFKTLQVLDLRIDAEAQAIFQKLNNLLSPQSAFAYGDKKLITEDNFEEVFDYWNEVFGESVRNGFKSSRYFVADIQYGKTQVVADQGKVYFQVGPEDVRIKKILAEDYQRFWNLYEKLTNSDTVRAIVTKIDRLTDEVDRRKHGEFFTPLLFAQKALQYIGKELGHEWWKSGEYRLWDMATGTGNLQYHLPADALPYTYLSTLYKEDVEHCTRLFPGATVFQYDYLNDDIGNVFSGHDDLKQQAGFGFGDESTWRLPEALRHDLVNPKLKWIILINPPFATAQQGGATGANKADVANTKVRTKMHDDDLGEVSRELFAQFLYRIRREFAGKTAWLGLFSPLKYINATNDQKLRDTVFQYSFRRGLMFSSVNFSGTSRSIGFPVGFLLWDLSQQQALDGQNIVLDVFDTHVQKIGHKRIASDHRDGFLSKWIARPAGVAVFPPFSSALNIKTAGPDIRDRISENFLGSLMCKGNDLQNQDATALFSGPYASAGSHSITPEIFEDSLVVYAVRHLPKHDWTNHTDQFKQANRELPNEFVNDCVVWSLFDGKNQTVAMRDVAYNNHTYQIQNHFFPIPLKTLRQWTISDMDIGQTLPTAQDRFVATWLTQHTLSAEAQTLLDVAHKVYQLYFASLTTLRTGKFKIETWDAGWYQIRNALTDRELGADELAAVKQAHNALKAKLLPQITELGFLG